jgi:hypothetical protein
VASFNEALKLGKFKKKPKKVNVLFNVGNSPPLYVDATSEHVKIEDEGSNPVVDVKISSDVATLTVIKGEKTQMRSLAGALLTGKLKIRGKPWKILSLYRDLWVFKEILSGKIT